MIDKRRLKVVVSGISKIVLNNYFFIIWLVVEAVISSILNFRGNAQSGLIQTYLQYANFIRSGFDLTVEPYLYTFPLWGYGFILSITKSKVVIIILQQIFAIITILFIDNTLVYLNWRKSSRIAFRIFVLVAFPWFFFHTLIWPYSWGANLLMIAIFLLFRYLEKDRIIFIALSALCFGIMLNFRSDYLFYIFFLTGLIPIIKKIKGIDIKVWHLLVWGGIILLLLIPWSQYSKIKSGQRLFKTTNKGHFLFISLGQLPENPWSITPFDKDSVMAQIVRDSLGQRGTITYQADTLLTKMWINYVKKEPKAFIQKCLANFDKLNSFPFYEGELWVHNQVIWEDSLMQSSLDLTIRDFSHQLIVKANDSGSIKPLKSFLFYQTRVITIFIYLALILYFINFRRFSRDGIAIIMFSMIAYQAAISILTFYTKEHNTNLYLIYVLWIIYIFNEGKPIVFKTLQRNLQKLKTKLILRYRYSG